MLKGRMTKRRSDATNAYDLLTDIAAYITEEPKRIFMGDWLITGKDTIRRYLDDDGPVCGTVGCIAGNAGLLTDTKWSNADRMLAGRDEQLRGRVNWLFYNTDVPARYGTKKYARIVAQRIRRFQKEHKVALLEVSVR